MDEDIYFWIKVASFLLTMFVSFQIGRYFERSRILKFLTKQGEGIEKILDEVFSPPMEPDFRAEEFLRWKPPCEEEAPGKEIEGKNYLS